MLLFLLVSSSLITVSSAQCTGDECKYRCNQGVGSTSAHEFSYPLPRSVFLEPCQCNDGWSDVFCENPEIYSKSSEMSAHTPSVCVCRKQSDANLRCEQFLTRCYKRAEGGCSCCFMQDEEHCDQVDCKDDRPQFRNTNTTCDCFHRPADYPTQICQREQGQTSSYHLSVLGFSVSAFLLLAIVVVVLCLVGISTMGCLAVTSNRRRRAREENERAQRERRERIGEAEAFLQ